MFQSNTKFYLRGTISLATTVGASFNISNDLELGLPVDTNGEVVSIVFKNDRQIERMTVTINQSVCTIVARGIEQQGGLSDTGLQKQWNEGVLGYITALDFDLLDKNGANNTISADNTFTGDNNFKKITFNSPVDGGLEVNSLTTTERLALSAVNGTIVYDETLGDFYMYKGGAWASVDTGTATPNMSETVNGTGEIATASERGNGTSIGSTGARLLVSNDALKKTSSGASDENKIPVLNAIGKVDDFVTPVPDASTTTKGIGEFGTNTEFLAGTDTTRFPNLQQTSFNIVSGDTILAQSVNTSNPATTSYVKFKEIQVSIGGTYKVEFNLRTANITNVGIAGRVYINGVAVGIERILGTSGDDNTYVEDFTVSSNTLIQLYLKRDDTSGGNNDFLRVKYNTVSKLPTGTVNL